MQVIAELKKKFLTYLKMAGIENMVGVERAKEDGMVAEVEGRGNGGRRWE